MALVSKNIPNLINGVSQQPPALRLASQAEAQENGFSDIVDGLKKRPPTQLKNKLKKTLPSGAAYLSTDELNRSHFHTYKRNVTEQYTVVTDPVTPKMYVYDINGHLRYESGVASWDESGAEIATNNDSAALTAYLGANAINSDQVAATSVADYTYFVNKEKVVTRDETSADNVRPFEGLFYMKQMNYGKKYRMRVRLLNANGSNGSLISGYLKTNAGNDTSDVFGLRTGVYFDVLLKKPLANGSDPTVNHDHYQNGTADDYDQIDGYGSNSEFLTHDLDIEREDETPFVVVKSTSSNHNGFNIEVVDNNGGTDFFAFKDTAPTFTSLPRHCSNGFTIQVNGDNQKKEDDFYVEYVGTGSSGSWKECPAPSRPDNNVYHSFNTATMPHTLSQNADLSFTFGIPQDENGNDAWASRQCGDDATNPFPSFVGGKINGVFFHRNRLGFLSDENVIFSEASSYFNFFRVTVRSLLDTAPIDIAVSQNEVSLLKAAVPAQDDLILFSDLTQFTLSADQLLTPSEIVIDQSTKYECDLTSTPVGAGTSVFFTTKSGDYSGVREFFTKDDSENKDAPSITSHVPEYINGTVRQMIASSNEDMLVCLTETDKKECYVYKWYNSDQERIQSAWSKWIFSKEISHVFFNNANLTIIFNDGGFEVMSLSNSEVSTTYQEATQSTVTGTSGSFSSAAFGYSTNIKGLYPTVNNTGSSNSSNLIQAYAQESSTPSSSTTYLVKVRALKTLFAGAQAYDDSFLPASIKITNNTTSYIFTKPVVVSGGNSTSHFTPTSVEANTYVDLEVVADSSIYTALFTGDFTVDFIYSTTDVTVSSSVSAVHLDHRKTLSGVTNRAALLNVYTPTSSTQYINHKGNLVATGTPADGDPIFSYLAGTHTTDQGTFNNFVYVGESYNFKYKLSEQVFKAAQGDPTRMARYQLRSMTFNYNNTGNFKVTVSSTGREDKVTKFSGRVLGQVDNILGYSPVVEEGTLKVGVQSQAQETDITITNDSHLPSTFQNAEVEAFVTLRNKRM